MKIKNPKSVIVIAGPTAVGKTRIAIDVAKQFNTEIISADSRQCYKELKIGVARPSEEELAEVPHHFIASHSIEDNITAAYFETYALEKAAGLFQKQNVIVMVGGTGLYIKAFCDGLDKIPEIDPAIREMIVGNYDHNGIGWLESQLREKDPLFSQQGEMKNPQRMMRALEVFESTGQSILSFHKKENTTRDFDLIKIGIELPKEELHRNINNRVDRMIEDGLVEEVKSLMYYRKLNALQTVGYSEIFAFLDGTIGLENAIDQIKINTRQYAKRQMTWFKKDKNIRWVDPKGINEIINNRAFEQ